MSVQATSAVIEHSQHKGSELLVLLMIANHAHADGTGAYPSIATLARETRLSERAVRYITRRLIDSGELDCQVAAGPKRANLYSVRLPGLAGGQTLPHPRTGDAANLAPARTSAAGGNPRHRGGKTLRLPPATAIAAKPSLNRPVEPSENRLRARATPAGTPGAAPTGPDPSELELEDAAREARELEVPAARIRDVQIVANIAGDLAREFGDAEPQAAAAAVANLFISRGIDLEAMRELMYEARKRVRQWQGKQPAGEVIRRKGAYWFVTLRELCDRDTSPPAIRAG